jgi:proteasome lid subunit RPN8/RPN11
VENSKIEIECSQELLNKLEEHCFSETKVEVGGFLIGKILENKTTVSRIVPAKHTVSKSTQLTFTHKTWDAILEEIKKSGTDDVLIGWYHSHPNFGVFLSDHDQFIQNNFFKEDGKVTIVVDPIRGLRGWFYSQNGKYCQLNSTIFIIIFCIFLSISQYF